MTITKTYCDKCGKEFERATISPLVIGQVSNGAVQILDLCPDCQSDLEHWYQTKNEYEGSFREVE